MPEIFDRVLPLNLIANTAIFMSRRGFICCRRFQVFDRNKSVSPAAQQCAAGSVALRNDRAR